MCSVVTWGELVTIWFIVMMILAFALILTQFYFPSGEGYTISHYHGLEIAWRSPKYAFKITAMLYKRFAYDNCCDSFIEYHKGN